MTRITQYREKDLREHEGSYYKSQVMEVFGELDGVRDENFEMQKEWKQLITQIHELERERDLLARENEELKKEVEDLKKQIPAKDH